MRNIKIDLHSHSKASDGALTPTELIHLAEKSSVTHMALTDHDTVGGIDEFISVHSSVKAISGIEISADIKHGELHIVGLFIDHKSDSILGLTTAVQNYRNERNEKLLLYISEICGNTVKKSDLVDDDKTQLGRVHMAKYLHKMRKVKSMQDAFDRYLASNVITHIPNLKIDYKTAIKSIKSAKGVAVLAHPSTLFLDDDTLSATVKEFKDNGLDAIEVFSSHTKRGKIDTYLDIAKKYDLAISGGSDYHGSFGVTEKVGARFTGHNTEEILANLEARREA